MNLRIFFKQKIFKFQSPCYIFFSQRPLSTALLLSIIFSLLYYQPAAWMVWEWAVVQEVKTPGSIIHQMYLDVLMG